MNSFCIAYLEKWIFFPRFLSFFLISLLEVQPLAGKYLLLAALSRNSPALSPCPPLLSAPTTLLSISNSGFLDNLCDHTLHSVFGIAWLPVCYSALRKQIVYLKRALFERRIRCMLWTYRTVGKREDIQHGNKL